MIVKRCQRYRRADLHFMYRSETLQGSDTVAHEAIRIRNAFTSLLPEKKCCSRFPQLYNLQLIPPYPGPSWGPDTRQHHKTGEDASDFYSQANFRSFCNSGLPSPQGGCIPIWKLLRRKYSYQHNHIDCVRCGSPLCSYGRSPKTSF